MKKFRRVNGALTYSQDLVKYQIPKWEKVLGDDCIISTCPRLNNVDVKGHYKYAIQYLHSYPYSGAVHRVGDILWGKKFKAETMIFITAYKAFETELKNAGFNAVYIPMAIDVQDIAQYRKRKQFNKKIIYFGNIVQNKLKWYNRIVNLCNTSGWQVDTISIGRFNKNQVLTRTKMLEQASKYKYGIAVGRCAQELHALDVRTIVAGHKFGGLITNDNEYRQQLATNMNGRICTYSSEISECLQNVQQSIIKTTDIKDLDHAQLVAQSYQLK